MSNIQVSNEDLQERPALRTSQKVRLVLGVIFSLITLVVLVYCMILGISALELKLGDTKDLEGLGFVVLLIASILPCIICLASAVTGFVLNITNIRTDVRKANRASVGMAVFNSVAAVLVILLFILMAVL